MYGTPTAPVGRDDGGASSPLRAQRQEAFVSADSRGSLAQGPVPRELSFGSAAAPAALRQAWARQRHRLPGLLAALGLHALLLILFLLPQRAAQRSTAPVPLQTRIITEPRVTPAPPPPKPLALTQPATRIVVPVPFVSIPDPSAIAATASRAPAASAVEAASRPSARPAPEQSVTPPQFDAAYLHNPAPDYPLEARRIREEGTVTLRVEVSPEGHALEVRVESSSGWRLLDAAAVSAVERWRFVPARQGSEPVAAWVLVPVQFELRS